MGGSESIQYTHAVKHRVDPSTQTPIFRNPEAGDDIYKVQNPDIHSIYSLFMKAKEKFSDYRCLGTKVSFADSEGNVTYEYQWKTFNEVYSETQCFAHAINDFKLYSEVYDQDFDLPLNVLGISSTNREEWIVTDLAANLLGITTVPLYETLGQQMLALILEQTELSTVFGTDKCLMNIICQGCKFDDIQQVESQKPDHLKFLKKVVCFDEASPKLQVMCHKYGIQIYYYTSLMYAQRNQQLQGMTVDFDHSLTKRESIFTISYTSGTEKNSKGVIISNQNFISAIENILKVAGEIQFNEDDVYMSYLPLAHVFDRLGVYGAMSVGAGVGFFGGQILKIIEDLQLLQPTIFPSVPRLLNKVYDRIVQSLDQASIMKRWLFYKGLEYKQFYLEQQGTVQYEMYDRIVFNKAKERLGGRVRVMITASAPIAQNILAFLKCVFCCPIIEAYGQTESCGASFSTKVYDNKTGHVGGPALNIEYKLVDVDELGYTQASLPYPKGEVCIRGPSVFLGYFKNRDLTQETVDEEGYLHTGDVGMILPGNALQIVDRIKNIFKLAQGEYIVAEKLERVYEQSQYVAQLFIHGDSFQSHIVAIIYPEILTLKTFCQNNNLTHESLTDMIQHSEVKALIEQDLQKLAEVNLLNSLEQIRKHFRLVDKEFELGEVLTPTMKLRRQQARIVFEELIKEMYTNEDHSSNV